MLLTFVAISIRVSTSCSLRIANFVIGGQQKCIVCCRHYAAIVKYTKGYRLDIGGCFSVRFFFLFIGLGVFLPVCIPGLMPGLGYFVHASTELSPGNFRRGFFFKSGYYRQGLAICAPVLGPSFSAGREISSLVVMMRYVYGLMQSRDSDCWGDTRTDVCVCFYSTVNTLYVYGVFWGGQCVKPLDWYWRFNYQGCFLQQCAAGYIYSARYAHARQCIATHWLFLILKYPLTRIV